MSGRQCCRRALNQWWTHTGNGTRISLPFIERNGFQRDPDCTECRSLNDILGECDLVNREARRRGEQSAGKDPRLLVREVLADAKAGIPDDIASEQRRLFNKLQVLRQQATPNETRAQVEGRSHEESRSGLQCPKHTTDAPQGGVYSALEITHALTPPRIPAKRPPLQPTLKR